MPVFPRLFEKYPTYPDYPDNIRTFQKYVPRWHLQPNILSTLLYCRLSYIMSSFFRSYQNGVKWDIRDSKVEKRNQIPLQVCKMISLKEILKASHKNVCTMTIPTRRQIKCLVRKYFLKIFCGENIQSMMLIIYDVQTALTSM